MGDPKRQRKKYSTPSHPWQATRIKEENLLLKEYGLKNKKELWKMESVLRKFKSQAKSLIATKSSQAEIEKGQLMDRLLKLNLIKGKTKIENIMALELKDILNRRLQTLVYNKGLAKSIKQARQFIIHGHVLIGDKKIDAPSYLVLKGEEDKLKFASRSSLSSKEHPERKDEKR